MKTKLLFINLSNLRSNAGHTARLRHELQELSAISDVSILSLGKEDEEETIEQYGNVRFYNYRAIFDNWDLQDKERTLESIYKVVEKETPDLVILNIEIWDLVVGLNDIFKRGGIRFVTVCHAMPFLISPQSVSADYAQDVQKFISSGIPDYRVQYISKHYTELYRVINSGILVANNNTVKFYLNNYFPQGKFWSMEKSFTQELQEKQIQKVYDFVYMARIEEGKGIEYLPRILKEISLKLERKINVAVMGRADDEYSRGRLESLINSTNPFYKISFFGWVGDEIRSEILNQSKCFIYPSVYDNFPTVVNEALSCGIPVAMWNTVFYRLNYTGCDYIKASNIGDVSEFVSSCLYLLSSYEVYRSKIIADFKHNSSSVELAEMDLCMFGKIMHDEKS